MSDDHPTTPWPKPERPLTPERMARLKKRFTKAFYDVVVETDGRPKERAEILYEAGRAVDMQLKGEFEHFIESLDLEKR